MSRKRHSAPAPQDGTVNPDLLAQLSATLWLPHDLDETEKAARMAAESPAGGQRTGRRHRVYARRPDGGDPRTNPEMPAPVHGARPVAR